MSSNNPFGPFDFEQLKKMLEQLGLGDASQLNREDLLAQVSRMGQAARAGVLVRHDIDREASKLAQLIRGAA